MTLPNSLSTTSKASNCSSKIPPETRTSQGPSPKPVIIGIVGIPGSGKSHLRQISMRELKNEHFASYESRNAIDASCPGGMDAYCNMVPREQTVWRERAITAIQRDCADNNTTGLVAAHYMFWPESDVSGQPIFTDADSKTYTHILYLDPSSETIARYRAKANHRLKVSIAHLDKWKKVEKDALRRICRSHGILFLVLSPHLLVTTKVVTILRDFQRHSEAQNTAFALEKMDKILSRVPGPLETVLLFDSDKTLTPHDSGDLFWSLIPKERRQTNEKFPLKKLFSSRLGYSYSAFRQAMLLYEEALDDYELDALCSEVEKGIMMYTDFKTLFQLFVGKQHIKPIVVTCGLRQVWEKVLRKEGLWHIVDLIGGGRLEDGFVVTAEVKGALVEHVRETRKARIWAFGDSPLDLEMLKGADEAVIVTGAQHTRSRSMDAKLKEALEEKTFCPRQVVLPSYEHHRLDTGRLPLTRLLDPDLVKSIVSRRLRLFHATDRSVAKLLLTPAWDDKTSGPNSAEAHSRVGQYLAEEFLSELIGLEEFTAPVFRGRPTIGHRLLHEKDTLIVALTQNGEPMASGVRLVFPLASFVPANSPTDVQDAHVRDRKAIFLVDCVVNSGQTVIKFIQRIRSLHKTVRLVVVAGTIHEPALSADRTVRLLNRDRGITFVTLCLSPNVCVANGSADSVTVLPTR